MRDVRAATLLALALTVIPAAAESQPLTILDVPFIGQSELLCGGAAAAMVMRYWGARGIDAESFSALVDKHAGGIRTAALASDIRARGWRAVEAAGSAETLTRELDQGRPVVVLLQDRPHTFHYVVVVARTADGVVFHDPARAPFRVASQTDFDRRWSAAGRWLLVVTPSTPPQPLTNPAPATVRATPPAAAATSECDHIVTEGVHAAQAGDLALAEQTLASAMPCPGAAPFRELAGVRLLQRRWPEAIDLSAAAVERDPSDLYSWRLLATARFAADDRLAALEAWNRAGEPRIDLIRFDGLARTRFAVVEHLAGLKTGEVLTRGALLRARRRLRELPAAGGTLDFQPIPSGLVEVRGAVAEPPVFPHGWLDLGVLSLATGVTREFVAAVTSFTGGGERLAVDWRFWPHRPLYLVSFAAPAPWRGVWKVTASRERQPFTALFPVSVRDSTDLALADWATGSARWEVAAGADRWNGRQTLATASAGMRMSSAGDRIDARIRTRAWFGRQSFQQGQVSIAARSSARPVGTVVVATGGANAVTLEAPGDLWSGGDTGRARPLMLRAHPLLADDGRFRAERLGRLVTNASVELQRWWQVGPFRVGGAAFVDSMRTAHRLAGPGVNDVDVGVGLRGAYPGRAGALRIDVGKGLRDGATAFSVVYSP
jgi:hypothetical protein